MFKQIDSPSPSETIEFFFEGQSLRALPGQTVASALLGHNITTFRHSALSDQQRGPYCLMGVCHECLVTINGMPNRQACMIPVEEGMHIVRNKGARVYGT